MSSLSILFGSSIDRVGKGNLPFWMESISIHQTKIMPASMSIHHLLPLPKRNSYVSFRVLIFLIYEFYVILVHLHVLYVPAVMGSLLWPSTIHVQLIFLFMIEPNGPPMFPILYIVAIAFGFYTFYISLMWKNTSARSGQCHPSCSLVESGQNAHHPSPVSQGP